MLGYVLHVFSSYYLDHDIWVNIYTVDSKWLYSLYWCMNVSSVTTNMCHEFAQMSSPVWHMVCHCFSISYIAIIHCCCVFQMHYSFCYIQGMETV